MPSAIRVVDDHSELTNRGVKTAHNQYHHPLSRLKNFAPSGTLFHYYGDGTTRVPSNANNFFFTENSLFLYPFLTLRNISVESVRFGVVSASFMEVSLRIGFYTATDDWQPVDQLFALPELTKNTVIGPGLGWLAGTYEIAIPTLNLPTGQYVWASNALGSEVATASFYARQSDMSQLLGGLASSSGNYRGINRLRKNIETYGPLPLSGASIQYDTVGTTASTNVGFPTPFGFGGVNEAN